MQTRDQEYASAIYEQVMKIQEKAFATSYGSMAHTLPILIHTSGLIQALAFVNSRSAGDGPKQLLEDLSKTVSGQPASDFLKQTRDSDLREYMYLTERTLAALLWYKRYAQSILGVEQGQNDKNDNRGGSGNGGYEK